MGVGEFDGLCLKRDVCLEVCARTRLRVSRVNGMRGPVALKYAQHNQHVSVLSNMVFCGESVQGFRSGTQPQWRSPSMATHADSTPILIVALALLFTDTGLVSINNCLL